MAAKKKVVEETKEVSTNEKTNDNSTSSDTPQSLIQDQGEVKTEEPNKGTEEEKESLKSKETESVYLTYVEAEELLNSGKLIAVPEWEGFWFKDIHNDKLLVFTKDNEILDTPDESYKERNDWHEIQPTDEQYSLLEKYFEPNEESTEEVENLIFYGDFVKYSRSTGGDFIDLETTIPFDQITDHSLYPLDQQPSGSFVTESGHVFSRELQSFTNQKID